MFLQPSCTYTDFYNFSILKDINEEPEHEEATCAVFKTRTKTDIFWARFPLILGT